MDEHAIRIECLRLALTTNPSHTDPPLVRAAEYEKYVVGQPKPKPKKAAAGPDGPAGKTARKPAS